MTKVGTFENKNVDLAKLYDNIKKMVVAEKFGITRDETTENSYHLKANKTGVTRIIVGAIRNVELVIAGEPDAFAVTLSVGAWGRNLALSTATAATTGYVVATIAATAVAAPAVAVGAIAAAGSYVSARNFEGDFFDKIKGEINKLAKPKKK